MMAKIASLFGSDADATRALDALARADYGEVETEVFDQARAGFRDDAVALSAYPSTSGGGVVGPGASSPWIDTDMGMDDDTVRFFTDGVRNGGVLVLVEVEDEQAAAVEQFLREHGGQAVSKDD